MLGTYKRILKTLCLFFSKMMSKFWNIGGLCLIYAIFHSLSSVKGKPIGKEVPGLDPEPSPGPVDPG